MSRSVYFSNEEVAEAAGKDPWQRQKDFQEEIDSDAMWEAARSYSEAAEGAEDASELAEQAGEENFDAANYQNTSLINAAGRLEDTVENLQSADITYTIGSLRRVIESADTAQTAAYDEIFGSPEDGDNLNTTISDYRSSAESELYRWQDQLEEVVESKNNRLLYFGAPLISPPATTEIDQSFFGIANQVKAEEVSPNTWALPESLYADIRQAYLDKAAEHAGEVDGRIEDHIEQYRSDATKEAGNLDGQGYDLGDSGFDIWYTDGMAEYHAERMGEAAEALEENPHDVEALDTLREVSVPMGVAADGLFVDGEVVDHMSDREREYILNVFNGMTADQVAAIGDPGVNQRASPAQENIANAINATLNPEVNGTEGEALPEIPPSINMFVDGYDDHLREQKMEDYPEEVEKFSNFGNLMGGATVPPGDEFGEMQFHAAVDVQKFVDGENAERDLVGERDADWAQPLENSHGGRLLESVSLNNSLSLDLMAEDEFRRDLMTSKWSDSTGAGQVLMSAMAPDGRDELAETQKDIADDVLTYYAKNPEELEADWDPDNTSSAMVENFDPSGLYGAMADMAILRMDELTGMGEEERAFDDETRDGVFTTLATADRDTYEHFKSEIFERQSNLYRDIYDDDVDSRLGDRNAREQARMLTDLMNLGEREVINHYGEKSDEAAQQQDKFNKAALGATIIASSAIPTVAGAYAVTGSAATAWAWAGGAGSQAIAGNSLLQTTFDDYKPATPFNLENHEWGDGFINQQMAYAHVVNGIAEARGEDGVDVEALVDEINRTGTQPPTAVNDYVEDVLEIDESELDESNAYGSDYVRDDPRKDDPEDDDDDDDN